MRRIGSSFHAVYGCHDEASSGTCDACRQQVNYCHPSPFTRLTVMMRHRPPCTQQRQQTRCSTAAVGTQQVSSLIHACTNPKHYHIQLRSCSIRHSCIHAFTQALAQTCTHALLQMHERQLAPHPTPFHPAPHYATPRPATSDHATPRHPTPPNPTPHNTTPRLWLCLLQ